MRPPPGDEIRIAAGTYTGVSSRGGLKQVIFVDKGLTLRGGFTTANWATPNPAANLTTVDAQGLGRGVVISGTVAAAPAVTVEGLRITGGNATGLGGYGGADQAGRRRCLRLPGPGDAPQLHDLQQYGRRCCIRLRIRRRAGCPVQHPDP